MRGDDKNGCFRGAGDLPLHGHHKPHGEEQGAAQKLQSWLSNLPLKTVVEKTCLALLSSNSGYQAWQQASLSLLSHLASPINLIIQI